MRKLGTTRRGWLALMLATAASARARAHAAEEPQPLAARFAVTVVSAAARGKPAAQRSTVWTLHRNAEQVALLKGAIDEIWSRDAQGRLSFQRVFHDYRKVTDYSTGELATLGINADWTALATLVDVDERAALKTVVASGSGSGARQRLWLQGRQGDEQVRIDWLPALQLPALVLRTKRDGSSSRIQLMAHAARVPPEWPQPGARSADYLHIDAADFGDMDYEPVVRLSEALDLRSGWRKPHAHD